MTPVTLRLGVVLLLQVHVTDRSMDATRMGTCIVKQTVITTVSRIMFAMLLVAVSPGVC